MALFIVWRWGAGLIGQPVFALATGLALKLAFGGAGSLALWIALSGPRDKMTETHV